MTGDESRLVEVHDVRFPTLHPIDDLPPATVITDVRRDGETLVVRGTTSDNGEVKEVLVNGVAAKSQSDNFAQWEATVPAAAASDNLPVRVKAHAIDAAGNTEPRDHLVALSVTPN